LSGSRVTIADIKRLFYEREERITVKRIKAPEPWSLLPDYRAGFYQDDMNERGHIISKPLYTVEVYQDGSIGRDIIIWTINAGSGCGRYRLEEQERADIARIVANVMFLEKLKSDV